MSFDPEVLKRLDRRALGDGAPLGDRVGDVRSGEYWLLNDDRLRLAIKVAMITGRPLLLEGPSGTGKSSLARAISETLGWTYYESVVTSDTRVETLTGSVDLVRRLHLAELAGRWHGVEFPEGLAAFLEPGVLWWAFDPQSAAMAGQVSAGGRTDPGIKARLPAMGDRAGAVVLIDEIDKAEPDVPNNLLVPLGTWEFRVEGRDVPITPKRPKRPLICITSNKERDMPPAFLRRCIAVQLGYPTPSALVEIARHHVDTASPALIEKVRERIAPSETNSSVSPAEFVDAVRAANELRLDPGGDLKVWEDLEVVLRQGRRS
jgi:MoxR-like ATPase